MADFLAAAVGEIDALSVLEGIAFLLGVAYLLLAIRESVWCWASAFVSTCIFAFLFARAQIYMDSGLQVFYAIMAVYGWRVWQSGSRVGDRVPVVRWPHFVHGVAVAVILGVSGVTGFALDTWTDAKYPYVDSCTTFASIWATFLVARKVLENWWYWLVIDAASIAIYIERGLEFAALLFVVYVGMIPFGLVAWTRSYRDSDIAATAS